MLMVSKLAKITHSDIPKDIKEDWKHDGQLEFWINKGWKTSISPLLIVTGFTGLFENICHHPVILMWLGVDNITPSIFLIFLGILNIWICDRVYEHYKLRKRQEQKGKELQSSLKIEEQEKTINSLSRQIAEAETEILIEKQKQEILEEKIRKLTQPQTTTDDNPKDDSNDKSKRHRTQELRNTVDKFVEDLMN